MLDWLDVPLCVFFRLLCRLPAKNVTCKLCKKMEIDVKTKAKCIASDSGGRVSVHADMDHRCQQLKCSVQHANSSQASPPYSTPSQAGASASCMQSRTLYATRVSRCGAAARRVCTRCQLSEPRGWCFSVNSVPHPASEIRVLGRVSSFCELRVCPLLDISCEILLPSKIRAMSWWIKVFDSELTL